MASSLASQLTQVRSLNAGRLAGSKAARQAQSTSYLFAPSVAAGQDLDTIHGLAENGWEELCSGDATFEKWNAATGSADLLFGDASRDLDRLTKTKEENALIDEAISDFLYLVGDSMLDRSAGKCIEWLVRRFRVHEYNVNAVLGAFLPFHESQEFARMLQILQLSEKPQFHFLISVQKQSIPLPSSVLLSTLLEPSHTTSSTATLRFVVGLPSIKKSRSIQHFRRHRHTLYSFWLSTIVKLCTLWSGGGDVSLRMGLSKSRSGKAKQRQADDAQLLLSILLPAALTMLHDGEAMRDSALFACMALCAIVNAFDLSVEAAKGVLNSIAAVSPPNRRARTAMLTACGCIANRQARESLLFKPETAIALAKMIGDGGALAKQASSFDFNPFLLQLGSVLAEVDDGQGISEAFSWIVESEEATSDETASAIVQHALEVASQAKLSDLVMDTLAALRQRRPHVWEAAYQLASQSSGREKSGLDKIVAELMTRQAGMLGSADESAAIWLGAHAAEASGRLTSLRSILASVRDGKADPKDSIVSETLATMLDDYHAEILSTLYEHADILVRSLGFEALCQKLEAIFGRTEKDSRLPSAIMSLHAKFVFDKLINDEAADVGQQKKVWSTIIWPRLLCIKGDRKAGQAFLLEVVKAFTNVQTQGRPTSVQSRLRAIADAIEHKVQEDNLSPVILSLTDALGAAIESESDGFDETIEQIARIAFGKSGSDIRLRSRLLATLTLRSIISKVQGARLVLVCSYVKDGLKSVAQQLSMLDSTAAPSVLDDSLLADAVYSKSTSAKSQSRVYGSLLAQAAKCCSTEDVKALGVGEKSNSIALLIFAIANKQLLHVPALSGSVTRSLLSRIGPALPTFLASLWTSSGEDGEDLRFDAEIRFIAMRYLSAYLRSFTTKASLKHHDFQTILPSLLVGLRDVEKRLRLEVFASLEAIIQLSRAILASNGQNVDIFGYDRIYGPVTADALTYLDTDDVIHFAERLVEAKSSFANDSTYLDSWMQASFAAQKGEGKRVGAQKGAIVHWLSSHIVCWDDVGARLALLGALATVSHESKLRTLLPLIKTSVMRQTDEPAHGALLKQLFDLYDKSAKTMINADESGCWTLFKEAIENGPDSVKSIVAQTLRERTFANLNADKQAEIAIMLANLVANSTDPVPREVRACLMTLPIDSSVLVPTFANLRETIAQSMLRAPLAKRSKTDTSSGADKSLGLASVGVLLELLEATLSRKPKAKVQLLTELFDCLRVGTELQLAKVSVSEQVLQVTMSNLYVAALSAQAAGITEAFEPMRVEALINVIKSPCRPQTFQQALLLLSVIGESAPELVLHHSMPIFTFVGSTMLQRDDEYSFNVIESTLQSILPPVVKNIRRPLRTDGHRSAALQLQQASRDLLSVFTDAATHIPRHRRQGFFHLLASIMGQADFLAPLCMLLVDRQTYKSAKLSGDGEKRAALQLPISLFRQSDDEVDVQLSTLDAMWNEALRTWEHRDKDPTEMQAFVFLDCVRYMESEHEGRKTDPIKRILALLFFIKLAVIESREAMEEGREGETEAEAKKRDQMLQSMIQIAFRLADVAVVSVSQSAQEALDEIMTIISVSTLDHVVTALLDTKGASSVAQHRNALQIFTTSLDNMFDKERQQAASITPRIIELCKKFLTTKTVLRDDILTSLDALSSIATQSITAEHGPLSALLPDLSRLALSDDEEVAERTLALLRRLSEELGPRLIPHLTLLVDTSEKVIRGGSEDAQQSALQVLSSLIKSVPTFMVGHLVGLFTLFAAMSDVAQTEAARKLLTTVNKYVAPSEVLQAVFTTYSRGSKSADVHLYTFSLDVVQLCLRSMDKRKAFAHHKDIFRFLVGVFDVRRQRIADAEQWALSDEDLAKVESRSVGVFIRLVFRLNEATFRPLFLRLCDWALLDLVNDDDEEAEKGDAESGALEERRARQTVLYKVLNALLGELGELVAHYYVNVLDATIDALHAFSTTTAAAAPFSDTGLALWNGLVTSVKLSCQADHGTFWNATRAKKLLPALVEQLTPLSHLSSAFSPSSSMEHLLSDAICAVCQTTSADEALLKMVNDALLAKARESDFSIHPAAAAADTKRRQGQGDRMRVRTLAVRLLERIWRTKGLEDNLLTLVPEVVPSIAELLQESEEGLQQAMTGFVSAIEDILGENLDTYLQ